MNSSDTNTIIKSILTALDPRTIQERVSGRIESAYASFSEPSEDCCTNAALIRSVARFVAHMYAYGMVPGIVLTEGQARQEAVHLLEQGYSNGISRGYEAALLDALESREDSMLLIRQRVASAIAARETAKYMAFAITKFLDPADWNTKIAVTRVLVKQPVLGDVLADYGHCAVFELAHHVAELIASEYQSEAQVLRVLHGRRAFLPFREHPQRDSRAKLRGSAE